MLPKLQAKESGERTVRDGHVSMGADRKANAKEAVAHPSSWICVSLRMLASVKAPSAPMLLFEILQAMTK